jgi:hypothetical protein
MASVSVQIRARSDALPRTRSLTRAIIRAQLMIMPVGRVDRAGPGRGASSRKRF